MKVEENSHLIFFFISFDEAFSLICIEPFDACLFGTEHPRHRHVDGGQRKET